MIPELTAPLRPVRVPAGELSVGDLLDEIGGSWVELTDSLPTGRVAVWARHRGLRVLSIITYGSTDPVTAWRVGGGSVVE